MEEKIMRRIVSPFILCLLLATTSCSSPNNNINNDIETDESQTEPIKVYEQPTWSSEYKYSDHSLEELVKDFPATLIDELSQSVYESRAESFIKEINDKTSMTTIEQIKMEQNDYLDEILNNKHLNIVYYQADTNRDGVDELFIITKGAFKYNNHIIMLTLQDDIYVYAGSRDLFDWIDGVIDYAVIQDENYLYVAAGFWNEVTSDNGIYLIAINSDSFCENGVKDPTVFIQQKMEIFDCVQVYQDENSQLIPGIKVYAKDVLKEIFYISRWWGSQIYGDEVYTEIDGHRYWAIDANNDGANELFNFHHVYGFTWYDNDLAEISWPLEIPQNALDDSGRVWFKVFDGKTILFSLYEQKDLENGYILDARICEDGNTTILLNYSIQLEVAGVRLNKHIFYGEIDLPKDYTIYHNYDYAQAFPQDKLDMASKYIAYSDEDDVIEHIDEITPYLSEKVVEVLSNNNSNVFEFSGYDEQIEKNKFFEQYAINLADKLEYSVDAYDDYVYKYRLNNKSYYLLTHLYHLEGDDGYTSRWINIYAELDGKMIFYNSAEFRSNNLRIFPYDNDIYVIDNRKVYLPNETGFIKVYKLQSDGKSNYAEVKLALQSYNWDQIFGNGESNEAAVSEYLEELKQGPLSIDNINKLRNGLFHADETEYFDNNRFLRLKTVTFGREDFFEIDFDNDGEKEYILYNFGGWISVYGSAYKFNDESLTILNDDWTSNNKQIVQLWFKELNGKVFTFQLLLCDRSYYILNISLIENGDITQVQNHLILPEVHYEIIKY